MNTPTHEDFPTPEETMPKDTKIMINTLLWSTLAPATTIGAAERIACKIFDLIEDTWETGT